MGECKKCGGVGWIGSNRCPDCPPQPDPMEPESQPQQDAPIQPTLAEMEAYRDEAERERDEWYYRAKQAEAALTQARGALDAMLHVAEMDEWDKATTGRQFIYRDAKKVRPLSPPLSPPVEIDGGILRRACMISVYEGVRKSLLQLGPHHPVFRMAIHAQARLHGFKLKRYDKCLSLENGARSMLLPPNHYPQVPTAVHMWDMYFDTIESINGVLDFSTPGLRTYKRTGVSLWSPGMAEDDTMDVYTARYTPQVGDVVWDVGAHAGATVYFFSQMVGPTGKVFAFEPDESSYQYLLQNIVLHKLANVVAVKKALAKDTGWASFSMDGTQGAGIEGFTQCADTSVMREVETLSFEDACSEYGVPGYVKMDIEGAEAEVVESSLTFIKYHPIHFAIESDHRVNGEFTTVPLCRMFKAIGYEATSSTEYGMQFMWAEPTGS